VPEAESGAEPGAEDEPVLAALWAASLDQPLTEAETTRLRALPGDVEEGLAWQARLLRRFVAGGGRLGGWKVGLSSGRSRDLMGPGVRPFGFIDAERVLATGAELPLEAVARCRLEPELCLVIGSELSGPVTLQQARAAVSGVAPAFEIVVPPIAGASQVIRVATRLSQWGIVTGAPRALPDDIDQTVVRLRHDRKEIGVARADGATIDDPFLSLARLSHRLADQGLGLEPGQRVIVGSLLPAQPLQRGTWAAAFGQVGSVSLVVR
jgi:2-keto-4-pentenoate hydratase